MPGVALAQLLTFTPIAFMLLYGALGAISPALEEAAQTLRASRGRVFRTVTWPLLRPALANAFLLGFVESLADFGNPIVLAGNFDVLSTKIFFAVAGAQYDAGRAAVLAMVLLGLTLLAFFLQQRWVGRLSYVTVSGKGDGGAPAQPAAHAVARVLLDRGRVDRVHAGLLRGDPDRRLRARHRPRRHDADVPAPGCGLRRRMGRRAACSSPARRGTACSTRSRWPRSRRR